LASKKWKTPWFPGFFPVSIDVHAGGVKGGIVEISSDETPF
jgi:hypothetical protein